MRRHLSTLLKLAVTTGGLIYVVLTVDLSQVGDLLLRADWRWLLTALLLVLSGVVVRALRWSFLLRGQGTPVPFGRLVTLYFVGNFFNALLPAGIGGDAVRILEVRRDTGTDIGAGTVIVDRLTGLMMQFVIILLAFPFRPAGFPGDLLLIVLGVALVGLTGGLLLLDGRLLRRLGAWLPGPLSPLGTTPVARLLTAVQGCGWPAVARAMGVSLLFNLLLFSWWWVAARALGYQVGFGYVLLVVPFMSLILLLPSIGGLGSREAIAPVLFAGAGLSAGEAVALSLTVFLLLRSVSLLGAGVYLVTTIRSGRRPSADGT